MTRETKERLTGNGLRGFCTKALAVAKACCTKSRLTMSTTTAFLRNMVQLDTLYELAPAPGSITVFGCSKGCEAYSLAMLYRKRSPGLKLEIAGFDVDRGCLEQASRGVYGAEELLYADKREAEDTVQQFLAEYLEPCGSGERKVAEAIRAMCRFAYGSILDAEFMGGLNEVDIIVCQNVLIHMTEEQNRQALSHLARLVRPGGLLVIGGMRLPVRSSIMKTMDFTPIPLNCREIHEGQKDLRKGWDSSALTRSYIAMPPFAMTDDWQHRFCTIFRKNG